MFHLKLAKNEIKIKFSRDSYTISRHPSIKDGLDFHGGARDTNSLKASNFTNEKGEAPMASSYSYHLFMIRRTMLLFILKLIMLKMFIMMLVMIVLFYLCVMMMLLLLAL
jgi:hypothetical protein